MTDENQRPNVWIFHGDGAPFAAAVFADRTDGLAWIAKHRLTGILSEYPVGDGSYDIAFSTSHTEHVHVRDGEEDHHYGEE